MYPTLQRAACLVVLPVAFLALAGLQLYPVPGWIDSGIYLGTALNYPDLVPRFGATYFNTRFGYTLPAYFLHAVFDHLIAHYVLALSFYFLATWSLYRIVTQHYGRHAGLVAAAWLAFNPLFVAAVTQGYVDGAAVAFGLAAVALLEDAVRQERRRPTLFAAAAAVGVLSVYSHPIMGVILAYPFAAALVRQEGALLPRLVAFGQMLAGAILVTMAILGMAWWLDLPLLHWIYLISVGPGQVEVGQSFRVPLSEWLPTAYRIYLPILLGLVGLLALVARPQRSAPDTWLAIQLGYFLFACAFYLVFDTYLRGSVTQYWFYFSYLLVPFSVLAGAVLGTLVRAARLSQLACVGVALIGLVVPVLLHPRIVDLAFDPVHGGLFSLALAGLIVIAALLAAAARRFGGVAALVALACVVLVSSTAATANRDTQKIFLRTTGVDFRHFYAVTIGFHNAMTAANLADRRLLFWFNRQDFTVDDPQQDQALLYPLRHGNTLYLYSFYDTLNSLYLWSRSQLNGEMPKLSPEDVAELNLPSIPATIVLLGQSVRDRDRALAALAAEGIQIRERASFTLRDGPVRVRTWLLDVIDDRSF